MKYIIATDKFNPNNKNPFCNNGTYFQYSCFSTNGNSNYEMLTTRLKSGCWIVEYNESNYHDFICDYIRYENKNNRIVIVQTKIAEEVKSIIIKSNKGTLPDVLVHSTSLEASIEIEKKGKITADKYLNNSTKNEKHVIQKYKENEPIEFSEYVMLGKIDGNTELVMSMFQRDSFYVTDEEEYLPGARIYLDSRKLDQDGLIVRDGMHIGKVFREISLDKYCIGIVRVTDLQHRDIWTPKVFQDESNNKIEKCLTIAST